LFEEYKLCSSSVGSFSHPPVTPSIISPNTLLTTLFSTPLVYVRFEVFMAVTMNTVVLGDVTPCGYCKNGYFGGASILKTDTRRNTPEDGILHFILRFSFSVRDEDSQPYKTTGNIIVLYTLIFTEFSGLNVTVGLQGYKIYIRDKEKLREFFIRNEI
jgi:hypothetical protein